MVGGRDGVVKLHFSIGSSDERPVPRPSSPHDTHPTPADLLVRAYGPLVSYIIVLTASTGTAESTAWSTCVHVTTPGIRFRLTTSAFGPFFDEAG